MLRVVTKVKTQKQKQGAKETFTDDGWTDSLP